MATEGDVGTQAAHNGVERLTNLTTGGPVHVDVRDGRILRIVPLQLDESDGPSWTIGARGRTYSPPRKTTLSPWTVAHRSTIYSSQRILTPLKRVDFDPHGDRNIQTRGESGYEPITWDEALDIVAGEITRIKRDVGPAAMMSTAGSHHLWGNIGYRFSAYNRFMNLVGFTYGEHNPDSWEGWHWGGVHMWGFSHRLGIPEQYDLLEDALKHTEMMVFWSADPETTGGVYGSFESTSRRFWLKELGVKMVFIDPYHNHTAGLFAGKWLAPRPGTDVALGLAIAFTWLAESTYDKEYVAGRTHGFDDWKRYVLGESDGLPKTPDWAERESGVPAREIRALAREWAAKKTMLSSGGMGGWGGACRAATGNEWARMMIALAAMQGLGKPGSNIWSTTSGVPFDRSFFFPGYAEGGISGDFVNTAAGRKLLSRMWPDGGAFSNPQHSPEGQTVPRLRIPEAMRHERLEWRGKGFCGSSIESQFREYQYPAAGYPHVAMYYRYGGSFIGTMTETNRFVRAYREGEIPFVVNQSIWFEGEARFADIILPACTNFERWDIGDWAHASGYGMHKFEQCNHRLIVLQQKCIEPLGASKSDYEIFSLLAHRLGVGDIYTEGGHTELDWVKRVFAASDLPQRISWEEFQRKGYYMVPVPDGQQTTPALRWFAEGRKRDTPDWGPPPWDTVALEGLQTQSGKIEFVSSSLSRFYASGEVDDPERPAMGPQYIESWEGHHTVDLTEKYPLQLISPHPRFSFHTMGEGKDGWANDIEDHRELKDDGWYYWIIRVNTGDAAARGIADGDLVRAYNDRGSVILAAKVTERVRPGTVHSYESCADYRPLGTPGESPDRAGCINILTPKRFITPTSPGQACNSCLVDVERWAGDR
jgi:anaerobic selenocysteine-containing dehydrogenase